MPGLEALDDAPAAFAIKLLCIDRVEVEPHDSPAARLIFNGGDEAARHALTAKFRIDIEAGEPGREISMGGLELVQDQEADAGKPPVHEGDKRGLGAFRRRRELGQLGFAVGERIAVLLKKGLISPKRRDRQLRRGGRQRPDARE